MNPQWTPENVVSVDLARRLIGVVAPRLDVASIELFGEGWDNTAYLVDDTWVFRFPRRQVAVELIRNECRILPALAPRLPLAIPNPVYVGEPSDSFPWPFAGYRVVPGQTACRAQLSAGQRAAAAPVMGEFLAALHGFTGTDRSGACEGMPGDTLRRLDLAYRSTMLRERFNAVRDAGLWDEPSFVDDVLESVPHGWQPRKDTLVHGDLYARHVLVNKVGHPIGVIDWGDVHLGDAAADFALAHLLLPSATHMSFRSAYEERGGTIDDTQWRVARFRALLYALVTLDFSHSTDDADLKRESHAALELLTGC